MIIFYYFRRLQHLFYLPLGGFFSWSLFSKTHLGISFTRTKWNLPVSWIFISQLLLSSYRLKIFEKVRIDWHPHLLIINSFEVLTRLLSLSLHCLYNICTLSQSVQSAWVFRQFVHCLRAWRILHSGLWLIGSHFGVMYRIVR